MNARARWITIIVGLLVANAIAIAILIAASSGGGKSRVLPEYSVEAWKK